MGDKATWQRFKAGDKKALSEIFHAHVRLLYAYGNKFTPDGQLVEDSMQELFLALWERREHLGDTDAIKPYLITAFRRLLVRKLQREQQHHSDEQVEDHSFDLEPNREEWLIEGEINEAQRQQLVEAMKQLSKRQKEAIYLRFYGQLDYDKLSETMDLNYQSTRNLVHTALKKLRSLMSRVSLWWWLWAWQLWHHWPE